MILDDLRRLIDERIGAWAKASGVNALPAYTLEEPPAGIDADVACNLAMLLAKPLRKAPRQIAQDIQAQLAPETGLIAAVSIAGAGFVNFRLTSERLMDELRSILSQGETFGRQVPAPQEKVLIEFVSANPTGPLHVGHGRGAALGDSLALIYAHLGYRVAREYYINDAGNQVQLLGESVVARALELQGKPFQLPEEGYHGDYVKDIARDFVSAQPQKAGDVEAAKAFALQQMQKNIEKDLADFGVHFDLWFSEASVVQKGLVDKHVARLKERGFVEEADGALWFKAPSPLAGDRGLTTSSSSAPSPASLREGGADAKRSAADEGSPHPACGHPLPQGEREEIRDKNRVIRRKDGRWTYFATDIAYHADKFERGFDRLIDVWGADHHGYVPRVKGSMQAIGYDASKLHVVLNQLVALTRNGVPVSMSKRSGDFIMLRDVVQEVGRDACRFFFAMRGPNTAFEFDLELAKKHSNDNPVYYLQYAHARICSIFRQAGTNNAAPSADFSLLKQKEERALINKLILFPHSLQVSVQEDSPHPLATYLLALCREFHHFYDHHRVLGVDPALSQARLALLDAVRMVLRLGLKLLGVSAPDAM